MANGRAKAKAAAAEVSGLSNADDAVAQRCDELIAAGRLQPIRHLAEIPSANDTI